MASVCSILALAFGLLCVLFHPAAGTPLDDYVNQPDNSYEYSALGKPVKMDNYTVYYLNMTSQTWLYCRLMHERCSSRPWVVGVLQG